MKIILLIIPAIALLAIGCNSSQQSTVNTNTIPQQQVNSIVTNNNANNQTDTNSVSEQSKYVPKTTTPQVYQNKQFYFSFFYPANWKIVSNPKLDGLSLNPKLYIQLINTKDFPVRGEQKIEIAIVSKEEWKLGGGEGSDDRFIELKNPKTQQPIYFALYQTGAIGDFYDHNQNDKKWFDSFSAEGNLVYDHFEAISQSLKIIQ